MKRSRLRTIILSTKASCAVVGERRRDTDRPRESRRRVQDCRRRAFPSKRCVRSANAPAKRRVAETAVAALKSSQAVSDVSASDFDAVFVPGGLGVMYDMPDNASVGKVLSDAWAQGKIVSAVCHGPGALLAAKDAAHEPLVRGKRVTGFTNTEEDVTGNTPLVPYLLEDKLKELGGQFERADDWQPYAVQDGRLITGQNPQSSKRVAELVEQSLM